MANTRVVQFFAYVTMFILFMVLWEVSFWLFEVIVNYIFVTLLRFTSSPLDLPTPITLLTQAISYFPDVWRIGNVLFWGFVEEMAFIAYVITGIIGALTGAAIFTTASGFLSGVSTTAGGKARP